MIQLIDTHAHLYALPARGLDLSQVVADSLAAGVCRAYMPNIDLDSLPAMLRVAATYPDFCKPMLGLHPCDVREDFPQVLEAMEQWLDAPFIAVGEVGIDLYHDSSWKEEQFAALEWQIGWARRRSLPLVLHCREAFDCLLPFLEKQQDGALRGVFHCFSGTLAQARAAISLGFHIGIGGIVTFPKSHLPAVVEALPLTHMVLETDAPYLAPVPYRGKVNQPAYLPAVARQIALLKGISLEEVAQQTTANALQLFGEAPLSLAR